MDEVFDVLYVEDDPASVQLLREAFAECSVPTRVRAVGSGPEALAVLERKGDDVTAPLPDLVLLDLDLGTSSGFDVLDAWSGRGDVPAAVVFTSSDDPDDVSAAYERGANAFVRKPDAFEGLVTFVRGAADFWGPVGEPTQVVQ